MTSSSCAALSSSSEFSSKHGYYNKDLFRFYHTFTITILKKHTEIKKKKWMKLWRWDAPHESGGCLRILESWINIIGWMYVSFND